MSSSRRYRLASRLTWILWTCATAIFALVATVLAWRAHAVNEAAIEFALADRALSLASLLEVDARELELEADPSTLPDYRGRHAPALFAILDDETATLLARSEAAREWLPDAPDDLVADVRARLETRDVAARWRAEREGRQIELLARRFLIQPEAEDDDPDLSDWVEQLVDPTPLELPDDRRVIVVVGIDRHRHDQTFAATLWWIVPTLLGGLLALSALVFILVRRATRPLDRLAGDVRSLEPTRLHNVAVPDVQEVAEVATAINAMVVELDEALTRERRFMADVAHELRTPVAELRSLAEVALRVTPAGESAHREDLEEVAQAARRMGATIAALSMLARADAGHAVTSIDDTVALDEVVREAWQARHDATAAARGLSVDTRLTSMTVRADRAALDSIVGNLVDNAVSYTEPGGRIEIVLERPQRADFSLRVRNGPVALDEEDVGHLFERFWRRDASRSGDHSGLGLAVSRELATALGLTLEASLHDTDLTMTLRPGRPEKSPAITLS